MIDTRAVGQELQEQLVGAARRGQAAARQAQEQARKAQAQVRKGQEAVTELVRTLSPHAEALRSQLPTIKLPSPDLSKLPTPKLPAPDLSRLPTPKLPTPKLPSRSELRSGAGEFAGQVLATQRKISEQVTQTAGPLLAQGAARVIHSAETLAAQRKLPDQVTESATRVTQAAQAFAAEHKLPEQVTQSATRVTQAAGPLLARGAARVSQAAQTLRSVIPAIPPARGSGHTIAPATPDGAG
ncbi:MAG: hypothetical protein ACRDRJ_24130, partial [Streptosporangiaceae bacterium]